MSVAEKVKPGIIQPKKKVINSNIWSWIQRCIRCIRSYVFVTLVSTNIQHYAAPSPNGLSPADGIIGSLLLASESFSFNTTLSAFADPV